MEKQECHQIDGEPILHITRCDELLVKLQHPGSEDFINTLVPNAIELGDNHAWHVDPPVERVVILVDWFHIKRVGAAI